MAASDLDAQPKSTPPAPAAIGMSGGSRGPVERLQLAAEIVTAYARARLALRRAPIAAVVAGLRTEYCSPSSPTPQSLDEARRLGWTVSRTLAFVPGDTRCLVQSLVLTHLLARRGIPAKLVIGARSGPEFLAHAWVEHSGEPVLTPGDGSFGRLVEL
jgi:hypothetical protein